MDSHTYSSRFSRLEVVDTGRRRRWSEAEKLRIVLESLQRPRLISATARRHGISRSLLLAWRRTLQVERMKAEARLAFVPAVVVPEPAPVAQSVTSSSAGCMLIVLGKGRRLIVDATVDTAALERVLDVLERR
jgi:transposase